MGGRREERLGGIHSFHFGNSENEPLFPKPKHSFPYKRGNKAKFCASFAEFIVLQEGLFPSTKEKEPISGPIITAANNY